MKNIKLSIYGLVILAISISSCTKDEEKKDTTRPTISGLEIGLGNSLEFLRGGDVHLEFEAADNEELGYYEIRIHPVMKSGHAAWEFEQTWNFEAGLKNALVHHHEIVVPHDADLGDYHFHLNVVDKAGNSTTIEEDVQVHESSGGDGPEIHVEVHPDDGQLYQTGDDISIEGHIHGETGHLAGVLIAIVKESDNLADEDVNDSNSIVMLHTHEFLNPEELEFDPTITVGATEDNNYPTPNMISDWNLNDSYILIKAKDENENWSFSEHYNIHVITK